MKQLPTLVPQPSECTHLRMGTLILSGVGGSSNWLPFLLPMVGLIALAYSVDLITRYLKKRKLQQENKLINDLNGHFEDVKGFMNNQN